MMVYFLPICTCLIYFITSVFDHSFCLISILNCRHFIRVFTVNSTWHIISGRFQRHDLIKIFRSKARSKKEILNAHMISVYL